MKTGSSTINRAPQSLKRTAGIRVLYATLLIYAGIACTYEVVNSISTSIGNFNLRNQVQAPFQLYGNLIFSPSAAATHAGIAKGDSVLAINGLPFTGMAFWQRTRWYAHPRDTITLLVRKQNGTTVTAAVRLEGYPKGWSVEDPPVRTTVPDHIFVLVVVLVIPLFCLALGVWVAFARPFDPNAWLILVLLTYPQAFNPGAFRWWIPAWLGLRLYWHLAIQFLVPPALFLLGLLFPERSRLDKWFPWLKWLVIVLTGASVLAAFVSEYNVWYDISLLPGVDTIDRFVNPFFVLSSISYVGLYWVLLIDKLRTASSSDARRRLQVLLTGSVVGLGSILIIWALLPYLGIADPNNIRWLFFLSIVLMLFFPLTLAYVVIVQRAMDVRLIIRQSLQYTLARRGVIILQAALSAILFIAVTTLVAAHKMSYAGTVILMAAGLWGIFLLNGITHRLAAVIDRRFFREAYDAEKILNDLAERVRSIVEIEPLMRIVAGRIAEALHVSRLAVLLNEGGAFELAYSHGYESLPASFPESAESVRQLKEEKKPLRLYFDDRSGWLYNNVMSDEERRRLHGMEAELLLPLFVKDNLTGFMVLGRKRSEAPYSGSDLRLLNSVAAQTGMAIEVSRLTMKVSIEAAQRERLNRELEIAQEVQQKLFPQPLPVIQGLDYCAECRPAREVGGDYYDFVELPDGKLAIAVGDVSGKGIGAALMMASLQASLRGQAPVIRRVPALLQKINKMVYESSSPNRYATFFYGEYDAAARRLTYVNAGHNPPIVLRGCGTNRQVFRWETGGLVIGLLPEVEFQEGFFDLEPGDMVVLFTDGISESMNGNDEEWGEDRLITCANTCDGTNAREALDRMMGEAVTFAAGAPQHDDMTLAVLRIT